MRYLHQDILMNERQKHYFMVMQQLVNDAASHWEVLMLAMYMRDPNKTSDLNPMWAITCSVMNTNHVDYDRMMFPYATQVEMQNRAAQEYIEKDMLLPPR